ncbi:MAG: outer membrane protein assembly factor BamE [Saezia sp.]
MLTVFLAMVSTLILGCGSMTPYKMEIVQGNFVSKEQLALIQPGMSRNQVRTILGTPLVTDIFHAERWDYVFSIKRKRIEPLQRKMTVFFEGDTVVRVDVPEELLKEEEFVQYLDAGRPDEKIKVPTLTATPEQLEVAARKAQAYREREAARLAGQADTTRPSGYYPPLE